MTTTIDDLNFMHLYKNCNCKIYENSELTDSVDGTSIAKLQLTFDAFAKWTVNSTQTLSDFKSKVWLQTQSYVSTLFDTWINYWGLADVVNQWLK